MVTKNQLVTESRNILDLGVTAHNNGVVVEFWYAVGLPRCFMVFEESIEMARPKGRPKSSIRNDMTVKVDRAIGGKLKLVATHRGISLAELISDLLRSPTDRVYAQMLRELEAKK
jgi:hypothetical protein